MRTPTRAKSRVFGARFRRLSPLLVAAISCVVAAPVRADSESLLGTWEYLQENSGSPTGFDEEGERVSFEKHGAEVTGIYLGLERAGEHGLFYSADALTSVSTSEDGTITFSVPARTLYCKRPLSLDAKKYLELCGKTGTALTYEGKIIGGTLVVSCSPSNECPAPSMTFRRLKQPS